MDLEEQFNRDYERGAKYDAFMAMLAYSSALKALDKPPEKIREKLTWVLNRVLRDAGIDGEQEPARAITSPCRRVAKRRQCKEGNQS